MHACMHACVWVCGCVCVCVCVCVDQFSLVYRKNMSQKQQPCTAALYFVNHIELPCTL